MLVCAGCGRSGTTGGKDCTAAANDVATFLTAMDHEPSAVSGYREISLVTRSDLRLDDKAIRLAPEVAVGADQIMYDNAPVDRAALEQKLELAGSEIRAAIAAGRVPRDDPPDPKRLDLLVDQRAAWSSVVTAMEVAHAKGFDHVAVVFGRPPKTPAPPHTRVDDDLDKLKRDNRGHVGSALAAYLRPKIEPCPGLVTAFAQASSSEHGDNAGFLVSQVGPALIDCKCAVDPAEMKSLFWGFVGNPRPLGAIEIELDPAAAPIAAAASAPWSQASARLSVDAHATWFTVEPGSGGR